MTPTDKQRGSAYCPQHQSYHTPDICRAVDGEIREAALREYKKAFRPLSSVVNNDQGGIDA